MRVPKEKRETKARKKKRKKKKLPGKTQQLPNDLLHLLS